MTLLEFFDPLDINHLLAYQHLEKKGSWPVGFIPDDVVIETNWQFFLVAKMADLWVKTNVFINKMNPENEDSPFNMNRVLEIAKEFEKKRGNKDER